MGKYDINTSSIGEAWKEALSLVSRYGRTVFDKDEKLYEILGMYIKIKDPNENDSIIKKYGDALIIQQMKKNFFSLENIPSWGYSYGQRLTNYEGINQIETIKRKLLDNIESKSATICLNYPKGDLIHSPCINVLDFKVRNNTMILNTFFRSQDICKKMYADAICLTLILKDISAALKIENTELILYIASAHIYDKDLEKGRKILNE